MVMAGSSGIQRSVKTRVPMISSRRYKRKLRTSFPELKEFRKGQYGFPIRRCAINSACRWRSGRKDSRRLLLRADQLAFDQVLGNLNCIEGRALTQVVGYAPQHQPAVDGGIFAHAADIGRVLAHAFIWGAVAAGFMFVDDQATRRLTQDGPRLVGRDRPFEPDIDRLRMADEHWHPYASG